MDTKDFIVSISYLVASVLFIFGIKMLGKTSTARKGNLYSALAMLLAIVATFYGKSLLNEWEIWVAILIGSAIGAIAAVKVPMTDMPEMVALFNGVGGLASLLVALAEFSNRVVSQQPSNSITSTTIAISILIGGVTFSGSLIAYGKLSGKVTAKAVVFTGQHAINLILLLISIGLSVYSVIDSNPNYLYA
ncbi:MAG: NAD(P)(+) transhydrogenase (Re/Si-specific) subunit beta, partial [Leptospiraceae bacterium]|nr:NAD(P)(+) transhydrogenase (Re/Si-specific) subunit beta [Leptospiraceae bacterium]